MRYFSCIIICVLITFYGFINNATAQSSQSPDNIQTIHYQEASNNNIAKLLWRYNLHDPWNDDAIDEYLQITNCDLIKKYYSDDFAWQRIRQGTRSDIQNLSPYYHDRLQIDIFIPIGRYDFEKSVFKIKEEKGFMSSGAIKFPNLGGRYIGCNTSLKNRRYFPSNIKFVPDNPYSMIDIPVPEKQARQLINVMKSNDYKKIVEGNGRIFPARLKLKINGIKSFHQGSIANEITFQGQLDEMIIFGDLAMQDPIWSKRFKSLNLNNSPSDTP